MNSSDNSLKGGILFCGGCNSRYDRLRFYEQLKAYYQSASYSDKTQFPALLDLYDPDSRWDFLVIINGCSSECLLDRASTLPTVFLSNGVLEDGICKINALLTNQFPNTSRK